MAGFLNKSIKLLLFFIIAVVFQIKILPWLFPNLRLDIFLCFVISLCIYARFPRGLIIVILTSFILQGFSGARLGYIPFAYTGSYFLLDMLKNILFLDTKPAQIILSFILSLLIAISSKLFSQINLVDTGLLYILISSMLTAAICPFVVKYTGRIMVKNEN